MPMNPDLTLIQTITIGVVVAVITLLIVTILLTLTYTTEIRNTLERIRILQPAQFPRTNFRNAPFPRHYVVPTLEPRPIRLCPHVTTTTTMASVIHQRTTTVRTRDSDESIQSRENIPRNATPGPSNVQRTPTPEPTITAPETGHLWVTNPDDPWASPTNAVPDPDPEYPVGVWNADDEHERFRVWNQPVAVLDEPNDPSPPYFTRVALATPRAHPRILRPGLPLRAGTIPFPSDTRP